MSILDNFIVIFSSYDGRTFVNVNIVVARWLILPYIGDFCVHVSISAYSVIFFVSCYCFCPLWQVVGKQNRFLEIAFNKLQHVYYNDIVKMNVNMQFEICK
jgi:hypothetical protein